VPKPPPVALLHAVEDGNPPKCAVCGATEWCHAAAVHEVPPLRPVGDGTCADVHRRGCILVLLNCARRPDDTAATATASSAPPFGRLPLPLPLRHAHAVVIPVAIAVLFEGGQLSFPNLMLSALLPVCAV